ncbi:metal-sulfur cluster assembly factor [Denitromonas iodatirespirans]|uniref:Metal-sulfur cluster assembly factor n=1 Tax=Denitromonas iodatirespirans TaxID=2795389 RepID=A0A944DBR1_DENI1|nr:metal-sulfur cluster assembly factor [Denitromonas iodatirespirans]MBT0962106.1 metal-sulfur cluster assembly factor [Denitromonas iodatirespirans]
MSTSLDEATVRDALRQVIDPEVGMNIVDLGLIYAVAIDDARIAIDMTMTSPACPMGQMIMDEVEAALRRLDPARTPAIALVWSPEWSPAMMSDAAKAHFGWQPGDD